MTFEWALKKKEGLALILGNPHGCTRALHLGVMDFDRQLYYDGGSGYIKIEENDSEIKDVENKFKRLIGIDKIAKIFLVVKQGSVKKTTIKNKNHGKHMKELLNYLP